jgi:NAD(P)-dependent dehydrogenase (short-subunit alcohol dehydrogenase family)
MKDLAGKSIIITGAASGMGKAMALGLKGMGAHVTAVDVSPFTALEADAQKIPEGKLSFLTVDLRDDSAGEVIAASAMKSYGHIYGLVNNAGLGRFAIKLDVVENPPKFWEPSLAVWQKFIDINGSAVFKTMVAVTPHMLAAGTGRIVNVTTSLNSMVTAGMSAYGPSKAIAEALSAVAAEDLAGTGITVNVLIPGGSTDTGMLPASAPVDRASLLRPEAMVPPVTWLLSEAGASTTGQRFRANLWDKSVAPEQAAAAAGAPVGWASLGSGASWFKTKAV